MSLVQETSSTPLRKHRLARWGTCLSVTAAGSAAVLVLIASFGWTLAGGPVALSGAFSYDFYDGGSPLRVDRFTFGPDPRKQQIDEIHRVYVGPFRWRLSVLRRSAPAE